MDLHNYTIPIPDEMMKNLTDCGRSDIRHGHEAGGHEAEAGHEAGESLEAEGKAEARS